MHVGMHTPPHTNAAKLAFPIQKRQVGSRAALTVLEG